MNEIVRPFFGDSVRIYHYHCGWRLSVFVLCQLNLCPSKCSKQQTSHCFVFLSSQMVKVHGN